MKNKLGFTLIEMLVVVLIIGILASVALPQYQMAVTKAKVAAILPIMRAFKDALMEYKLQHGDYGNDTDGYPDGDVLGVFWPSDWNKYGNGSACGNYLECSNDYWDCIYNEGATGSVGCGHDITVDRDSFSIIMYQPDEPEYENFRNKITCYATGDEGHKVCKALGGKLPEGEDSEYILY